MLLAKEFVAYLSRQLVKALTPQVIETTAPEATVELIAHVITDELQVEDRLNDEVREILGEYADYMRRESISYQEMFRRIKNTLISQRKVIRASGRDTGDHMKLSRDKINDVSHKLVQALRKSREARVKKGRQRGPPGIRAQHHRDPPGRGEGRPAGPRKDPHPETRDPRRQRGVGAPPQRYYAEELKKMGIDLAH